MLNNEKIGCTDTTTRITRQATYACHIEVRSRNHCYLEKQCSECVSAVLVIQIAKHMHRIMLSHLWPVWLYHVSTLSHKRPAFQKIKVIERQMS